MPSKAKPKAPKRAARVVERKSAAAKVKAASGKKAGQSKATKRKGPAPSAKKRKVMGPVERAVPASREPASESPASRLIDQRIRDLGDWRGETLARVRRLILDTEPELVEEWKWRGTPVWSHHGIVCTGESYAKVVKLTFARGAALPDPAQLFNSSLEGNTRRAIDIREGERIDLGALKALLKAAIALNTSARKR